jgi:hypothetical protein
VRGYEARSGVFMPGYGSAGGTGHEQLHTAYEWPGDSEHGWDTTGPRFKDYQEAHQKPFDDAADQIK